MDSTSGKVRMIDEILMSVNGTLSEHQKAFLKILMNHYDSLKKHLTEIEKSLEVGMAPFALQVEQLCSIYGISTTASCAIIAEIGIDMNPFKTAEHICSWAGLCLDNNESAGKRKSTSVTKGNHVPLEEIPDGQKRKDMEYYLKGQTELEQVLKLVSDFKILLLGKDETELDSWMKKAEILQIAEINSFLKLIRSDLEAVKNAIKYDYSNGPAEGHNNKIKVIKRQMYGRCKFDLLRLKVLC